MGLAGVARKRTLTQAPLLCALAAVVAVLTFVLTGVEASFSHTQDEAVAKAVARAPARDAAIQITSGVDRPEEGTAAKAVVDRISGSAPTDVVHRFRGDSFKGSAGRTYVAATLLELPEHADLVDGRWAEGDDETSVQADSGLAVGDAVFAGDVRLEVVGAWRAQDPADPRWFADPAMLSGAERRAIGPLIVSAATLEALPTYVEEQWTIIPRAKGFGTDELQAISDELADVLADDPPEGVAVEGQFVDRIDAVNRAVKAGRGLEVVALMVLGLVGFVTLLQLLSLLGDARQRESALLRARGASVPQIARWHGLDVAIISIIAAAVSAGVVAVTVGKPSLFLAACAAAPAVILGPLFAARRARTATARAARETSVALGSVTFLACAAATLTVLQFLTYGSAITTSADGRPAIDPLTVAAPALTVVAGALLGALVAGPLAAFAARRSARRTGLTVVLGLRQIARRPRTFGVLVALSAIVVGNALAASTYAATARSLDERVSAATVGADVRVELDIDAASPAETTSAEATRFAALPGVSSSAPGLSGIGRIDEVDVPFLAIGASDLATMAGATASLRNAITTPGPTGSVVTESLAETFSLHVGDAFDIVMPDGIGQLRTVVRKVVRVLPGVPADGGMLVDLAAVQAALATGNSSPAVPNLFLLRTDDPGATARAAATASAHVASISTADTAGALVRSAAGAWVGTTLGVVVLGLLGIAAVAVALVGRRGGEVRVLRALGLRTSGQRRARLAELVAALAVGAGAGVVTGVVVVAATVPGLARSPRSSQAPDVSIDLQLDAPLLGIALAMAIVGLAIAGAAYARAISRQAAELVRGEVA